MPKPSALPRWADVGGDLVEPNSGKKDIGFVAGKRGVAQYFNWLFNLIYQWCQYISDGVFTGIIRSVDGLFLGDGTPGVKLECNSSDELHVRNEADNADGDIRYDDDHHGVRTLVMGPAAGTPQTEAMTYTCNLGQLVTDSTEDWQVPINLRVGDRILAIRGYVERSTAANIVMEAYRKPSNGAAEASLGSDTTSAVGTDTLAITGLTETVDGGDAYHVRFAGTSANIWQLYAIQVDYDRP